MDRQKQMMNAMICLSLHVGGGGYVGNRSVWGMIWSWMTLHQTLLQLIVSIDK